MGFRFAVQLIVSQLLRPFVADETREAGPSFLRSRSRGTPTTVSISVLILCRRGYAAVLGRVKMPDVLIPDRGRAAAGAGAGVNSYVRESGERATAFGFGPTGAGGQPAVCGTCTHGRTSLPLTLQSLSPPRLVHPRNKAVPDETPRDT
jgi:hypothetical protein